MTQFNLPLKSLNSGNWFKIINGASLQHLATIRSVTLAYTLAGADCIDVASDPAAISVAKEAINLALSLSPESQKRGFPPISTPWLMVSLNDGEDPHFRKAEFDPNQCPPDCPRPCETVCPALAIAPTGVIDQRCYGCGRCLPVCPLGLIVTRNYVSTPETLIPTLFQQEIDAVEIHTQPGHLEDFQRLWKTLQPWHSRLKLLAISCPDHPDLIDYLRSLLESISPLSCLLLWQTDGRPMSGDLGKGTTHAAIKLARKVLNAGLPGYVQLAGGTNAHTGPKLREEHLLGQKSPLTVAGVAYGSYARKQLLPLLEALEERSQPFLEQHPDLLWLAVRQAAELVKSLRGDFLSNE